MALNLLLNGTSDYAAIPNNSFTRNTQQTFEIKFSFKVVNRRQVLFAKSDVTSSANGFYINYKNSGNLLEFVFKDASGNSNAVITSSFVPVVDKVYTVFHTVDFGIRSHTGYYTEGTVVTPTSSATYTAMTLTSQALYIGKSLDSFFASMFANIAIKNVRIYNRLLTTTEMLNNHNGTVTTSGLVTSYDMSTGTVNDQTVNGNNATLNGGTWVDDGTGGGTGTGTVTSKSLSDIMTFAETFSKVSSLKKTLSDSITSSEIFTKQSARFKSLSDSVSMAETFDKSFAVYKVLSDSTLLNDVMSTNSSRLVQVLLNDSVGTSDSFLKQIASKLYDSLIANDTLSKSGNKNILDSIVSTELVSKRFSAMVIDVVNSGDNENENSSKKLTDSISSTDTFTSILRRFITLTDSIGTNEQLSRDGGNSKSFNESISITDTLIKRLTKLQTDSIASGDIENERLARTFLESISPTDSINAIKGKAANLMDAITITDSIKKSLVKVRTETVFTGDSEKYNTTQNLNDIITQSDVMTYTNGKRVILTDTLNVTDTFAKSIIKVKLDSLGVFDSLQKQSSVSVKLYDVVVTNDSVTLSMPNLPEYRQIIEYVMKINTGVDYNLKINTGNDYTVGIVPVKEFKFKI